MTCLRCGDNLAGLQHPHTCPGAPGPDRDRVTDADSVRVLEQWEIDLLT